MDFDFDSRGVETVYQLSLIKRLFHTLENQLCDVQVQTIKEMETEHIIDSPEAYDEMRSIVGSQENHHETEAQALRSAELIRLYMLLESELSHFCAAIKSSNGRGKDLGNFRTGGFIKRAKALLCDHAQLLSAHDSVWKELEDFRILRVYLVHSSKDNSNQKARNDFNGLVTRRPELCLSDSYELALERKTCDHFHAIVNRFFEKLFDSVGWRFRQEGPIIVEG